MMQNSLLNQTLRAGADLQSARAAVILLHGRGGSARDILSLADYLPNDEIAFLAPEARGNTWYPYSFLAPLAQNQPALDAALATVSGLVTELEQAGIARERVLLAGFSQGACLAQETAIRNPARYGAIVGLSGGLIGPPGRSWQPQGDFAGTPVFLGCSDVDPHIPLERVEESAAVFSAAGARVDKRIYPGMAHTINQDELSAFAALLGKVLEANPAR